MVSVLIVDDEPLLREELQESLELEDFEVTSAENVDTALELCGENEYDIVVTDLKMPHRTGLELLAELRARGFPGKLFVVSGHGAETNRHRAECLGATACFPKPLDVDGLVDAINQHA